MSPWTVPGRGRSLGAPGLKEHVRELLGVQRVAAGAGEERAGCLGRDIAEHAVDQRADLRIGKG